MDSHGSLSDFGADAPRRIAWMLHQLIEDVPGVTHAVLVSLSGMRLASAGPVDRDLGDQLSAVTAALLGLGAQYGHLLHLGQPESLTIRFPHGHVAFTRIGDTAGLCLAAQPNTDLRAMAYRMRQVSTAVGHALTSDVRTHLHHSPVPPPTGPLN